MKQFSGCLAFGDAPLASRLSQIPNSVTTARTAIAAPVVVRDGAFTIAIEGNPRLRGEARADGLPERILEAYRREGVAVLGRLGGPFAVAILDAAAGDALLAIDRMGIQSLCWAIDAEHLLFGSAASNVARLSSAGPKLNHQAVFDFILAHVVPAPHTVYEGVFKLLGGTYLQCRRGRVETSRYWTPDFRHAKRTEIASLRDRVLPTIEQAIARCAPDERTGTFLSGGLDSSTVTGLAAKGRASALPAFSVGFGVDEFNELSYAKLASERFGCTHHVYEVVPEDVVELIPRIAAAYDEPFGNSSAVPTFCCARLAKEHGVEHLLAGDGGDEIFGGNARYVRQKVFEAYGHLPRWLRTGLLEPIANRLDPESGALPLRKFSSYVRQARVPLPERFETWNLIYREGPTKVFDAEFLSTIDVNHPLFEMREFWEACPSRDVLDRMLWYDWKLTLADNDIRKVSQMCESAGVRVSYPMLDEDLVDLSIAVPSEAKIAGGELRSFFKNAVRDLLPQEIIRKQKHGFGLPFGVWLKTHEPLQRLVYGTLEALRARNILQKDFVDRVANEHRSGHAGYYGYAIWDMVMLEQWLQLQPRGIL